MPTKLSETPLVRALKAVEEAEGTLSLASIPPGLTVCVQAGLATWNGGTNATLTPEGRELLARCADALEAIARGGGPTALNDPAGLVEAAGGWLTVDEARGVGEQAAAELEEREATR
jgi:hypothetical protein